MKPSVGTDLDHDAGIVDRVVLRFLKRHRELLNNRVILVGESYGGVRATLMLQHLFNVSSLLDGDSPYIDGQLWAEETDYFTKVFGTGVPSAAQVASRFGHQVLIEAVVAGPAQAKGRTVGTQYEFPASNCLSDTCSNFIPGVSGVMPTCDQFHCDQQFGWSDDQEAAAAANLVVVDNLSQALGVGPDLTNIEWMKASARTGAYGRNDGDMVPAPEMTDVFGTLDAEDAYFVSDNHAVLDGYPGAGHWYDAGPTLAYATDFANRLHDGVSTFMTAAKYDLVVWAPEIPYAFAALRETEPSLGAILQDQVQYVQDAPTGLARPGAFWLNYAPGFTDQRMVTMPHFYDSGHSVTIGGPSPEGILAPGDLLADVMLWYNNSPH